MITHLRARVPCSKSTRELKYSGAKVPGNESSSVLLELSFLGANSFGSEKAESYKMRKCESAKVNMYKMRKWDYAKVVQKCI